MLEQLRAATRTLHDEVEQLVGADKMKQNSFSRNDYTRYLLASYRFHLNIESACRPFAPQIPYSEERIKTPALREDLLQLQIVPADSPKQLHGNSFAAALGYLYVSEGSMLGAQVIYKSLLNNPQIQHLNAFRFLTVYNKRTGVLWSSLVQALEKQDARDERVVVNAALEAFGLFNDLPGAVRDKPLKGY